MVNLSVCACFLFVLLFLVIFCFILVFLFSVCCVSCFLLFLLFCCLVFRYQVFTQIQILLSMTLFLSLHLCILFCRLFGVTTPYMGMCSELQVKRRKFLRSISLGNGLFQFLCVSLLSYILNYRYFGCLLLCLWKRSLRPTHSGIQLEKLLMVLLQSKRIILCMINYCD